MFNQTLNNTIVSASTNLNFSQWTNVTTNPVFLISIIGVWAIPLLITFILAFCIGGGTGASKMKMYQFANFWIIWLIFLLLGAGLILGGVIFPIWLYGGS